jgi:phosphopantothenoylcysteine synthetase/decarboxylase
MTDSRLCPHLLIGVCGSIHCVHIHEYLLRFRESFAQEIRVILTASAERMVRPETLALYVDDRIFTDPWDRSALVDGAAHIQLTRWADLFLVLPATANILGKAANGIADDLLSTAIVSSPRPVVFAPAMNPTMWANAAVRRNVSTLRSDGHTVVEPEEAMSITSGDRDLGLAPSLDGLLPHLQHVRMKALKEAYWEEATRERAQNPAQRKLRALAAATQTPRATDQEARQ